MIMWPMHDDQVVVAMVTDNLPQFISSKQLNTVQRAEVTINFYVLRFFPQQLPLGKLTVLKLAPWYIAVMLSN